MSEEIMWRVSTHEHRERSADWYWGAGLAALAGAALCVYAANYLLAAILIIGVGSLLVLLARGPREHDVTLDRRGVTIDGTLYPWRAIQSFWVEDAEAVPPGRAPRLFIVTGSFVSPRHVVPLDDLAHASAVRGYLKRYAAEEEQEPHLAEYVAELLGL